VKNGERQRQDELRHREEHVGHAHHQLAAPAAEIARDQAERHADRHRRRDHEHRDAERDARAQQDAREDVAPQAVGAEQMRAVGRPQPLGWIRAERILGERRDPVGEQRDDEDQRDDDEAGQRRAVAGEFQPDQAHHICSATRGSIQAWIRSTRMLTAA
jgi:hypothetical protein